MGDDPGEHAGDYPGEHAGDGQGEHAGDEQGEMTRGGSKISIFKKSGNGLPGVENVGGPWGSIFKLSRGPQLPYNKNLNFETFLLIIPPPHPHTPF